MERKMKDDASGNKLKMKLRMLLESMKLLARQDPVFCIAGALAAMSCFIVKPTASYAGYIDWRTLVLLFSLMAVVAGFSELGVFRRAAAWFIARAGNVRRLGTILVLLCFFTSMFVTNDVALITFVPLAIIVMHNIMPEYLGFVLVMQTVAANTGSMLTPFGNPQNLYIYSFYEMKLAEFFRTVLPAGAMGLVFILVLMRVMPSTKLSDVSYAEPGVETMKTRRLRGVEAVVYLGLFVLCIMTVLRTVPYMMTGVIVLVFIFLLNRKILLKVDYALLVTFVFFFIFVGNMGCIEYIDALMQQIVRGNELAVSICASQLISNVPAAVLLSGFTDNAAALVLGTNLGGLGTLIASMASLISFKLYMRTSEARPVRYVVVFSIINFLLLAAECGLMIFLNALAG